MKNKIKKLFGNPKALIGIPYGLFMFIFIVVPLFVLLLYAFSKKGIEGKLTFQFTFENFKEAFSPIYLKVLWRSILTGIITTLICLIIGYPIAYFLANKKYTKSKVLVLLFIIPMWINLLLITLATKAFFNFIGLKLGYGAIIIGMVYNFIPFMIVPIYNSISKIDYSFYEASADLGASPIKTFIKIILPLSIPGIVSGITMVFTPSITTYVVSDMLSNNKVALIGNMINLNVMYQNYNVASAISFIILIFILFSMALINRANNHYGVKE